MPSGRRGPSPGVRPDHPGPSWCRTEHSLNRIEFTIYCSIAGGVIGSGSYEALNKVKVLLASAAFFFHLLKAMLGGGQGEGVLPIVAPLPYAMSPWETHPPPLSQKQRSPTARRARSSDPGDPFREPPRKENRVYIPRTCERRGGELSLYLAPSVCHSPHSSLGGRCLQSSRRNVP